MSIRLLQFLLINVVLETRLSEIYVAYMAAALLDTCVCSMAVNGSLIIDSHRVYHIQHGMEQHFGDGKMLQPEIL